MVFEYVKFTEIFKNLELYQCLIIPSYINVYRYIMYQFTVLFKKKKMTNTMMKELKSKKKMFVCSRSSKINIEQV
jgi:hypothetical protein